MNTAFDPNELAARVAAIAPQSARIVTGFDGFVDEMITLVGERSSPDDFTAVPDIATFGRMITAAAGHSSLREIIVNTADPGGCAVNLADGLASLGVAVDCFATLGDPMHAAFREVAAKCAGFHSWGNEPGRTLAFEFDDGKLMFSAVRQLADFTPETVRVFLSDGTYQSACGAARIIALTDWTLYPHMTAVWRLLQREVFAALKHRPLFFIDLVDPAGRSADDILAMAAALPGFEASGPVTLGLNGNEANILSSLHGLSDETGEKSPEDTLRQAHDLRLRLGISRVIIHHSRFAVSDAALGGVIQRGPYCSSPKKSTGAGDRFNAGWCLGHAHGMGDAAALTLGCAASGFFVRHARSATLKELADFLQSWHAGNL
jgi:sugar/nucleoside kinase (ribokinase family)